MHMSNGITTDISVGMDPKSTILLKICVWWASIFTQGRDPGQGPVLFHYDNKSSSENLHAPPPPAPTTATTNCLKPHFT